MRMPDAPTAEQLSRQQHQALHLAHRWFAFFEAPGADLEQHLQLFHPRVQLSGQRQSHLFADDHESLRRWFAAVPDERSAHHIIHSSYATASNGDGLLDMLVAYQAPGRHGMQGSIISYATRIEFAPTGPRFVALDKTPILPNRRQRFETSWAINRVLACVHAELGGEPGEQDRVRAWLGDEVWQLSAEATAGEGSVAYDALLTAVVGDAGLVRVLRLRLLDDVREAVPTIIEAELLLGH